MKVFLDTEFYEFGDPSLAIMGVQLISIGLVTSDGREFYAENKSFDWATVPDDHWLQANVRPHLAGYDTLLAPSVICERLIEMVGPKPTFYGWYADYDWVVLCSLFGRMVDLPENFPKFCRDLKQTTSERHIDAATLPKQISTEHNALNDARWNKQVYEYLQKEPA